MKGDDREQAWADVRADRHARDITWIFTAARLRICPRLLVSPWARYVMRARTWFESGQLGVDYVHAPPWISSAFAVITSEMSRAEQFKREQAQASR